MQRRKGATFERWLVADLKAAGFPDAKRNLQSQHVTDQRQHRMPDVSAGAYGIEAKHWTTRPTRALWAQFLAQCEADCADSGLLPVVIYKQTRGPIEVCQRRADGVMVRLYYEDWKRLVAQPRGALPLA